jgi:hypothetical protein
MEAAQGQSLPEAAALPLACFPAAARRSSPNRGGLYFYDLYVGAFRAAVVLDAPRVGECIAPSGGLGMRGALGYFREQYKLAATNGAPCFKLSAGNYPIM